MKIRSFYITLLLVILVSACSAPATPTTNAVDIQNTAKAAALTVVAQTLTANPTATAVPPTETLAPTNTPEPSPTVELSTLISPTSVLPTVVPTNTQQSQSGNGPCDHALLTWESPTASFKITNETKPKGEIILLVSVVTPLGECGWLPITGNSFSGPIGSYGATAFVSGDKNFRVNGSFKIQEGGWKIVVRNDTIVALGSCYPNC